MSEWTKTYDEKARGSAQLRLMRLALARRNLADKLTANPDAAKAPLWLERIVELDARIMDIKANGRERDTGNPVGVVISAPPVGSSR